MRRHGVMRVTKTTAQFEPIPMSEYPALGLLERARYKRDRLVLGGARALRARWPSVVTSPRLRSTGLLDPDFSGAPGRRRTDPR